MLALTALSMPAAVNRHSLDSCSFFDAGRLLSQRRYEASSCLVVVKVRNLATRAGPVEAASSKDGRQSRAVGKRLSCQPTLCRWPICAHPCQGMAAGLSTLARLSACFSMVAAVDPRVQPLVLPRPLPSSSRLFLPRETTALLSCPLALWPSGPQTLFNSNILSFPSIVHQHLQFIPVSRSCSLIPIDPNRAA